MKALIAYLVLINIATYVLMGLDKKKAQLGAWRVPEKTLLGLAAAGGSVGEILGMYQFHHKTRHAKFRYGLPVILAAQLLFVWFFFR